MTSSDTSASAPADLGERELCLARALSGVRVLDLTRLIPGPLASLVLADLGASVDKIEDAGMGDYLRYMGARDGVSPTFAALNRGKRSAVVNLKIGAGRDALERLLGSYDVLFEQFRPGVLARLGLSHELLRKKYPRLIICALTGYGQTGPLRDRAGHDLNYLARAGVLGLQGPANKPQVPAFQLADSSGALWSVIAIMAALRRREQTGQGETCDIALTDGALSFAALDLAGALNGQDKVAGGEVLSGGIAAYGTYLARDGKAMTLAALEPKFWTRFCGVAGIEADFQALVPGSHQTALRETIRAVFAARSRAEWETLAEEHDFMVEPVLRPHEIADDPQLRARNLFFEQTTPSGQPLTVFRTPVTEPGHDSAPAPGKGEHTKAIFLEAGFSSNEVDELLASGALCGP